MASAQGKNNKLLKKIYKALKMPQDSTYLQDIVDIANNKVMMQLLSKYTNYAYIFCIVKRKVV